MSFGKKEGGRREGGKVPTYLFFGQKHFTIEELVNLCSLLLFFFSFVCFHQMDWFVGRGGK